MVADQPLILSTEITQKIDVEDGEARARYNLRKLSELPYHLIRSEMWNEFVEVCFLFFCFLFFFSGGLLMILPKSLPSSNLVWFYYSCNG